MAEFWPKSWVRNNSPPPGQAGGQVAGGVVVAGGWLVMVAGGWWLVDRIFGFDQHLLLQLSGNERDIRRQLLL